MVYFTCAIDAQNVIQFVLLKFLMIWEIALMNTSLAAVRLPLVVYRVLVAQQARPRGVALPAEWADVLEGVLRLP